MRLVSGLIFDFDGVLRPFSYLFFMGAYDEMIRHKNRDPEEFYNGYAGFKRWSDPQWTNNLVQIGYRVEEFGEAEKIFSDYMNSRMKIYPWVPELLPLLRAQHRLAIFSNSNIDGLLKALGELAELFELIIGGDQVKKMKPDPEGILLIMKKLGWSPRQTLKLGDMRQDILAGKAAKTRTGLTLWNADSAKDVDITELGADYIFTKPEELLEIR